MFERLVADGDRTSTGGVVFGDSDFFNEEGKAYARKENKATCGNCKGLWAIYGTADNWTDVGEPYVKDGDRVLCPCGKNFVSAAFSSDAWYSDDKGNAKDSPAPQALIYDQHYTLRDSDGQPIANLAYRMQIGGEVVASGVTDSEGRTVRISTEAARRVELEINGRS
ncbi:PAAR domain-containing protein [Paraburkholderia acidisoli]|uniref:PAAR motif-containing protein n=1 Tax=Paraburkholderia acidisoli TaxID=2571748 RepID=A0A7Z2JFS7_9BURK|nr:PAAR domain-containing protein [Paraburkholderia acidisoli]QGZ62213.1 hypothetical protein FAZ98_11000 [Paraburkholderia acidisoli]